MQKCVSMLITFWIELYVKNSEVRPLEAAIELMLNIDLHHGGLFVMLNIDEKELPCSHDSSQRVHWIICTLLPLSKQ